MHELLIVAFSKNLKYRFYTFFKDCPLMEYSQTHQIHYSTVVMSRLVNEVKTSSTVVVRYMAYKLCVGLRILRTIFSHITSPL